jgi:diguanylate cyclase
MAAIVGWEKVWRWWMAAGALAIGGYYLLPPDTLASNLAYDAVGLACGLAILVAVRRHRPDRPAMWYWFAAGQFASVLGDLTYGYYQYVLHSEPYPSPADIFYLASYPLVAIGLVLLIRNRRGARTGDLINPALAATGLGLLFWVFVLHPVAAEADATALERVISTAYPVCDVLLLAMVLRLTTDAAGRTASTRLIGLAAALVLVADTAFSLLSLYSDASTRPTDALFLFSYLCWGAAALHPSAAAPATSVEPDGTYGRLGLFAAFSLVSPALLMVPSIGDDRVDRLIVAAGGIVLFLLVIARLSGMMVRAQRHSGELHRLAMRDDLTGLANRRQFEQTLRGALAAGPAQVALLGLNGFKNVNDELGRPIGDRVLGLLADRLLAAVPAGTLVARTGGDEFAVLLTDATGTDAHETAGRILAALHEPISAGGHELLVGVGIGLAGGARLDSHELLRRAESAMHTAKGTGEPVRQWTPALDERAVEHTRLGAELRLALDAGQFRVFYQPIVEAAGGRVAALEALVRWEHPERGLVGPVHFVPVAEQNGLIVELGAWVLRTACARMAGWRAELGDAAPDKVSVNVSARQLARPGFAGTVAAALAETGLPARCLAVEVTETAVFEGGQALTALHELRALGVLIALDDFGTGHSSLGLLQTVPVDILKVDKSFVDEIGAAGRRAVIAEALIQVSTGLGLTAVAEGVETAEQAAALHELGYHLLQGYHFGRPVADPDFTPAAAVTAA